MAANGLWLEEREAELFEAPAPTPDARPVSGLIVALLVLVGLAICVGVAGLVSKLPPKPAVSYEPEVDPARMAAALDAYRRDEWDEAEKAFLEIRALSPHNARVQDYLDRIALTGRDAERLAEAEEALVAGDPPRARDLASMVAPNSPLFAQAESVARSAREQLEHKVEAAPAPPPTNDGGELGSDIRVALGEALALYEAGNFGEAASRADALAQQAQGDNRRVLAAWAADVRSFEQRFAQLPRDPANLANQVDEAREAIQLDVRLSDGHYARGLRVRVAVALAQLAQVLIDTGDVVSGCVQAHEAASFDERQAVVEQLTRRCENEAYKRIAQARALEAHHPDQALKLYRQSLVIAVRGASSYRAAQKAIADLEWSEER